ncbi:MAG: hypothetical protein M0R75_11725 [Dehalococcoidia bacterium]|nr:hypothetical protein [Dehalococcoidia bacterium]
MPDQTPEVCAECGMTRVAAAMRMLDKGLLSPHDKLSPEYHPFRPAEPTPAELPEGETARAVMKAIESGSKSAIINALADHERAISSAAVAEAEDRWRIAEREVDRLRSILGRLRKRYERVSTVYQVREADNDIRRILSESFTPEDAAVNTRVERLERALEEAREALRYLALSVSHGGECPSCGGDPMFWLSNKSGHAPQCALIKADQALTRALVSTESEATS